MSGIKLTLFYLNLHKTQSLSCFNFVLEYSGKNVRTTFKYISLFVLNKSKFAEKLEMLYTKTCFSQTI